MNTEIDPWAYSTNELPIIGHALSARTIRKLVSGKVPVAATYPVTDLTGRYAVLMIDRENAPPIWVRGVIDENMHANPDMINDYNLRSLERAIAEASTQ